MREGGGKFNVGRAVTVSLLVALVLLVAAVVPLCLVPPVAKDVLIHHLAVPKLYLEHGEIYEIPAMVFSYYPMNLNLLYTIPLAFGNDVIPALIHFAFALATAWVLFSYTASRLGRNWGLAAALLFLSTPIVIKLSSTAYIDLGVIFFSTASLLLVVKWLEGGFQPGTLVAAGAMCGLAMGTKYNALISFLLLFCAVVFLRARYGEKKSSSIQAVSSGVVFALTALVLFAPWAVRNYLWTGNPLYPLFDGIFNPGSAHSASIGVLTYRETMHGEKWWEIAALPVRVFFGGADGDPARFDGVLNPFLFLLPWLGLLPLKKTERVGRYMWVFAVFAMLFFFFGMFTAVMRIRYISPIIPPLVILSVYGLHGFSAWSRESRLTVLRHLGGAVVGCVLVAALWLNGGYLVNLYRYVSPFECLSGEISMDDYISRYRGEYRAMLFMNENLPEDARVLFLFIGNRGYYCDREYIYDMQGARSTFEELVNRSMNASEVSRELGLRGITHMLVDVGVFERWAGEKFDSEKIGLIQNFLTNHTRLIYIENGYAVLTLR
jgi:4-amino-4-deoxy-L-arabinose transferase-like glycosyltransferase